MSKFKKVQITASIDDLNERNDYIRAGSNWNEVINNLNKLQSYPWIEVSVCQTISWLNVFYINDFKKFMRDRKLHVHMNYVYDPDFLSLKVVPEEFKQVIIDRCTDLTEWEITSLVGQFSSNSNMSLLKKGVEYNKWLDISNNKSFKETFPDWANKLSTYYE